ncbi:hypothetical protein BABINDRAFT_118750 [Babjeviella inositovora NRRL Y-12698]|uniref:Uncharacterized protein n=1 Tax=Babjeviella inositovora NRRL Y-12698 TaxID=984486 RepID=A0A1E3QTK3_9ASCO|nr:uncharacterized protein BABINDRAFT_118750 [Babjeviella inositovora NRRL Y-12698]ODQ80980.1 hypothetical protein BABINDRAFT_118750 [Babjeviella inositovora NRRL Y-12698]
MELFSSSRMRHNNQIGNKVAVERSGLGGYEPAFYKIGSISVWLFPCRNIDSSN